MNQIAIYYMLKKRSLKPIKTCDIENNLDKSNV